jgi:hypothetical protein
MDPPELVRKLSTGGHDAPASRYLRAEHDDVDMRQSRTPASPPATSTLQCRGRR